MAAFDGFLRILGIETASEKAESAARQLTSDRSQAAALEFEKFIPFPFDAAAAFGKKLAPDLSRLDNDKLRRLLPNMSGAPGVPIPVEEHARKLHVARALEQVAKRHLEKSKSKLVGGSAELWSSATHASATRVAHGLDGQNLNGQLSISDFLLKDRARIMTNAVRYLSIGPARENALDRASNGDGLLTPDAAECKRDVLATEVAMGRAGVISASKVIELANVPATARSLEHKSFTDNEHACTRVIPDFAKGRDINALIEASPELFRGRTLKKLEIIEASRSSLNKPYPETHKHLDPAEIKSAADAEALVQRDRETVAIISEASRLRDGEELKKLTPAEQLAEADENVAYASKYAAEARSAYNADPEDGENGAWVQESRFALEEAREAADKAFGEFREWEKTNIDGLRVGDDNAVSGGDQSKVKVPVQLPDLQAPVESVSQPVSAPTPQYSAAEAAALHAGRLDRG